MTRFLIHRYVFYMFLWGFWLILGHIVHKGLIPEVRFPMYMLLSSFLLFLPDYYFCYCICSIISFLFGNTYSFYFPSSADSFDAVSRIEVCASRSVLIISSFLISSFYKKTNMFLKNFLWFLSAIQTLIQIFNFLINIRDFLFYVTFHCSKWCFYFLRSFVSIAFLHSISQPGSIKILWNWWICWIII